MKKVLLAASLALSSSVMPMVLAPSPVNAANANNPYGNIDHSNDDGNNTGDSRVDGLNANQLNENYKGPWQARPPSATAAPPPPPPMAAPPQPQLATPMDPAAGSHSSVVIVR